MAEESFVDGRPGNTPTPRPNAGDPVQVRTIERLQHDKRDEQLNDLKALLSMPEGRRVLWRVLEHCGIYASTYSAAHSTASFLEGQRQVGTTLISWLGAVDPLAYPRLMAEGRRDRATDEAILAVQLADAKAREQKSRDGER